MESTASPYIIFRLRARRDELLATLSTEDHGHQPVELDQSRVGRLSRIDAIAQSEMAKASHSALQTELRRVEAAIARIENGSYGSCCRCGQTIDRERIQADPAGPFCLSCFEEIEGERNSGISRR
ncbi:MAG TPA: TraR/DksA C4-type zinc finger protein [Steroidobacteraceae bacterium]|nr:TraR/DksA C4-type zinc finger protein [Steroidobacteraceae bacterium]